MARIGLSGLDLYPLPTLSDTTSAKNLFELVAGYTSQESFTDTSPPSSISSQVAHYQDTYRKMKRLSPVWLIDAVGSPDAAFVDIDLEDVRHEVEDEALAQRKQDAIRERHENKVHMLTTALHSLLLDDIEAVDDDARIHIFGQLVEHLLDEQIEQLPKDDNELLGQLRSAAAVKTVLSTDANNLPDLQVLLALQSVPVIPLAERRGQQELSLGGLLKPAVHDELLGWTLHNHRVREDPDFPQVPIWDERADSEREHLHLLSLLREENSPDFFTHATFVKETRISLLPDPYPSWNEVQDLQEDSLTQCKHAFEVEITKAKEGEPFRLLAARIEHLLPTFRRLPKEDKVLPYISLAVLQAADFLALDDFSCRHILRRETRLLLKQPLDVARIQYASLSDLPITYPNGKLAAPRHRPPNLDHARRARINTWAGEVATAEHLLDVNRSPLPAAKHAGFPKQTKRDAVHNGWHVPARLRNSLRSVLDAPHPALAPCMPVPDGHARREKALGLLGVCNVQTEEEGRVEERGRTGRRALFAGGGNEGAWEMGVLGAMGDVEGVGGGMVDGLPVDAGVFGFAGVMVPGRREF